MPDMQNKGKKRVYPKLVVNRQLNTKEFIEKMHFRNRAISPSVTTAVLTDIADYLGEMLSMGYTVKLDGLGTFSLSLDFDDEKTKELTSDDDKMLYRKVKVKDVNFKSDSELVKYVNQEIDLEREPGGVTPTLQEEIHPRRAYPTRQGLDQGACLLHPAGLRRHQQPKPHHSLAGTQEVDHRSRCSLRLHRQRKPQDLDR